MAAAADAFDIDVLIASFGALQDRKHDVPIEEFFVGVVEVVKMVRSLGMAFGFAADDISTNQTRVTKRLALMREAEEAEGKTEVAARKDEESHDSWKEDKKHYRATIQYLVGYEYAGGVSKTEREAAIKAASRILWFFDFTCAMLSELRDNPKDELSTCASTAYSNTLQPKHGFLVRTAVGAALGFVPYRKDWLATVVPGAEQDAAEKKMTALYDVMEPLRTGMWKFYHDKGIGDP